MQKNKDVLKANLNDKNEFFQKLQGKAFEFLELSKQAMDSLTDEEHLALKELSKDKTIVISKADNPITSILILNSINPDISKLFLINFQYKLIFEDLNSKYCFLLKNIVINF